MDHTRKTMLDPTSSAETWSSTIESLGEDSTSRTLPRPKRMPPVVGSKKAWRSKKPPSISPYSRPQSAELAKVSSCLPNVTFNRRPKSAADNVDGARRGGGHIRFENLNARPKSSLDTIHSPRCFSVNSTHSEEVSTSSLPGEPHPIKSVRIATRPIEMPQDKEKVRTPDDRSSCTSSPLPPKKCKTMMDYKRERLWHHDKQINKIETSFRKHGTSIHSVMEMLKAYGYSRPMSSLRPPYEGKKQRQSPKPEPVPVKIVHQVFSYDSYEDFESTREKRYVDDNKWPTESPVAGVYDVTNSSAKMIIYNNKKGKGSGSSRLRGYSNQTPTQEMHPERHLPSVSKKKNPDRHSKCNPPKQEHDPKLPGAWLHNATHGHEKEASHDYSGRQISPAANKELLQYLQLQGPVRAKQVLARGVPDDLSVEDYRFLQHPELTGAEKKYLMSVASVYNVSKLKQNKQNQYRSLLRKQLRLGFASASEYEKYIRYLEGPRNVQPGHRSETPDPTPKSKKSEALLTRRRAAQDTSRASHDGATSPGTDEEYIDLKHKRLKSAPPTVNRTKRWEETKEKGKSRFVEVADAESAPKRKGRKAPREVWDSDHRDEENKTAELSLLKKISDEADRNDDEPPQGRSSRASSGGSAAELTPYPPYTPREGVTRPRSRLGRKKPKPEEYEDLSEMIHEDKDTNTENSLVVVMENDESFDEEIDRKEMAESESREKSEAAIQTQLLENHKDMSTSITDMAAYLSSLQPKVETCEMGTSMDDRDEQRSIRREKRRKRREERERQAEELRNLNKSLASLKSELERSSSKADDSSVISRDTLTADVSSPSAPVPDEEVDVKHSSPKESEAPEEGGSGSKPERNAQLSENGGTEVEVEEKHKITNEKEKLESTTTELAKNENLNENKEETVVTVDDVTKKENNLEGNPTKDNILTQKESISTITDSTLDMRANLTNPIPIEARLESPAVIAAETKPDEPSSSPRISPRLSDDNLPNDTMNIAESEGFKKKVIQKQDDGDDLSLMMRMEENPLDPVGTTEGLSNLIMSPPPPVFPPPQSDSSTSLDEIGENLSPRDTVKVLPTVEEKIDSKEPSVNELEDKDTQQSSSEPDLKDNQQSCTQPEVTIVHKSIGEEKEEKDTQTNITEPIVKEPLDASDPVPTEKNDGNSDIDLETSRLCNNAVLEATLELSREDGPSVHLEGDESTERTSDLADQEKVSSPVTAQASDNYNHETSVDYDKSDALDKIATLQNDDKPSEALTKEVATEEIPEKPLEESSSNLVQPDNLSEKQIAEEINNGVDMKEVMSDAVQDTNKVVVESDVSGTRESVDQGDEKSKEQNTVENPPNKPHDQKDHQAVIPEKNESTDESESKKDMEKNAEATKPEIIENPNTNDNIEQCKVQEDTVGSPTQSSIVSASQDEGSPVAINGSADLEAKHLTNTATSDSIENLSSNTKESNIEREFNDRECHNDSSGSPKAYTQVTVPAEGSKLEPLTVEVESEDNTARSTSGSSSVGNVESPPQETKDDIKSESHAGEDTTKVAGVETSATELEKVSAVKDEEAPAEKNEVTADLGQRTEQESNRQDGSQVPEKSDATMSMMVGNDEKKVLESEVMASGSDLKQQSLTPEESKKEHGEDVPALSQTTQEEQSIKHDTPIDENPDDTIRESDSNVDQVNASEKRTSGSADELGVTPTTTSGNNDGDLAATTDKVELIEQNQEMVVAEEKAVEPNKSDEAVQNLAENGEKIDTNNEMEKGSTLGPSPPIPNIVISTTGENADMEAEGRESSALNGAEGSNTDASPPNTNVGAIDGDGNETAKVESSTGNGTDTEAANKEESTSLTGVAMTEVSVSNTTTIEKKSDEFGESASIVEHRETERSSLQDEAHDLLKGSLPNGIETIPHTNENNINPEILPKEATNTKPPQIELSDLGDEDRISGVGASQSISPTEPLETAAVTANTEAIQIKV